MNDDAAPDSKTDASVASSGGHGGTSLQLEMTLDGFRFSTLPPISYFGCLVGLPLTFLIYVVGFMVLPRVVIDWFWLPMMVVMPFIWIVPMAYINAWRDERHRKHFAVDAAGLVHDETRYTWAQIGTPVVSDAGLVLADSTRFDMRLDEQEQRRLRGLLDSVVPDEPAVQTPDSIGKLMSRQQRLT